MKQVNPLHNTFVAKHVINMFDGKQREVTVVGVRNEISKNDIKQKVVDHGKTIDTHLTITRNKIRTFDVVYTIKNPEDNTDKDIMLRNLNRRLKRGDVHLHLESPQYFGSKMCRLIVQNELEYIVEHINEFIKKL